MVLNQRRHPGSWQVKTTLHFLLFEDKGRLQAHGNGIKIWLLPGQSLSRELERDWHLIEIKSRSRHSQLGLFNCWIGHNYPIPRWARWPNQNGVIHTISIGDNLYAVPRTIGSSFKQQFCFILDGSAIFIWDLYWNGCNLYRHIIHYNGLFLEQLKTHNIIFQLVYNNTKIYNKSQGLLVSRL